MRPKCLNLGVLHSEEGEASGGRREAGLAKTPGSQAHLSCPSQAEGSQTPLDTFQLPARVACEDASSPEPEPVGEPCLQP